MSELPSPIRDAFYALVLEEIRCQPDLQDELGANDLIAVAARAFAGGLEAALKAIAEANGVPPGLVEVGFRVVRTLAPPPNSFLRDAAELLACGFGSNYDALCRSALLHLFWGQLHEAEKKVNVAKLNHDDRAFAHHVYGLLRGLQGDGDGAIFELGLAHARESLPGARQRIELALKVSQAAEE